MPLTPSRARFWRAAARVGRPLSLVLAALAAARADQVTAIFAQTSPGYARKQAADGRPAPETYTLGNGGALPGAVPDPSLDGLNFIDLAKLVTGPLEAQNFRSVPDRDPNKTQLLVMVYWGTTRATGGTLNSASGQELQAQVNAAAAKPPPPPPPSGPAGPRAGHAADQSGAMPAARQNDLNGAFAAVAAEDRQRAEADLKNAQLLGYDAALTPSAGGFGAAETRRADLIGELEEPRYFIVLMAYDFEALWKHRRHTLLWVIRLSVRARGTRFDGVAPAMLAQAGRYFGNNSGGLRREALPEGRVDIGTVKSLGEVPTR